MEKNGNDLFRLSQEYKPQQVGIEVTGQQQGFINWIQQEMMSRNCFFTLASQGNSSLPGIRPNTNKMQRFNNMVPTIKAGKLYLPEESKNSKPIVEALNELSLASPGGFKSKHDDFIDTISMLADLQTWRPSDTAGEQQQESEGLWDWDKPEETSSMDSYLV
jgi:predicted phage terminase large subunit-like protein